MRPEFQIIDFSTGELLTVPFRAGPPLSPRSADSSLTGLADGDLVLDVQGQQLSIRGMVHQLTRKECRLLQTLMEHAGQTLSYPFLMREVWGTEDGKDIQTLRVHITWLRSKIEKDRAVPGRIQTIRQVGYRYVPQIQVDTQSAQT